MAQCRSSAPTGCGIATPLCSNLPEDRCRPWVLLFNISRGAAMGTKWPVALLLAMLGFVVSATGACAQAPNLSMPSLSTVGGELVGDSVYLIDNVQLDFEDILTSPLHITDSDSPLFSPKFYLGVAGAGALFGVSFALDKSMQSGLGHMSHSAHDILENFSYTTLISAVGLLYIYGLYDQNDSLRHYMLTGTEAAGVGVLFNLGIKSIFGRLRPSQTHSHTAFFYGSGGFNTRSFTSNDMVITTAMATGVSEYFDNEWYVAIPIYTLPLLEGFTRMGDQQQWFSDVVMGGLLGWGTAELLLYLHKEHALEMDRWRIISISAPATPTRSSVDSLSSFGLAAAYSW
jgi:membrane-associated phospholipid phosphatase